MNTGLDPYTRVYLRRGTTAHLIKGSPNDQWSEALCGRRCGLGTINLWHGTGTQDEIEQATELPLCVHCERRDEQARATS